MNWAIGSQATRPIASSRCRLMSGLRVALIRSRAPSTGSPCGGQIVQGSSIHWAEHLVMSALQLLDLQPLPEPLVEIAQLLDAAGPEAQRSADRLGGADGVLAGSAIQGGQFDTDQSLDELLGQPGDLGPAPLAERDVEDALNAILLVVDRRAGADQDDLGHSCDRGPAGWVGARPRSLPRRIPSANSARAAA